MVVFWIILGIPFFIPAIILYIAYVNYALLITNKRVIKRKWILFISELEIRIEKIESVNIQKGLLFDTLVITGSGGKDIEVGYVANAKALRDAIYEQTGNNRDDFQDKTEEYMNIEQKAFKRTLVGIIVIFLLCTLYLSTVQKKAQENQWTEADANAKEIVYKLVFPDYAVCSKSISTKNTEADREKQKKICKNMLDGLIAEDHDNINTYMEASKKESVYQCLYTLSIKTERNDTFASKEEIDACINK